MNKIKYLLQFIFFFSLILIFKIIGLNFSRKISKIIFSILGPYIRKNKTIDANLKIAFRDINQNQRKQIIKNMWSSYGNIFAEYIFIKNFRHKKLDQYINIEGQKILDEIKNNKKNPVIFISGHFDNFELMAMHIEKSGVDLAAIYRPLNNPYLNPLMEKIRKNYICKKQIKKGISGTKEILKYFKTGTSIALMIDQRVSEGIKANFFSKKALTTTIPAQFVKKFNCKIVPVEISRHENDKFNLKIYDPIAFSKTDTIQTITETLNNFLEKMILKNPSQWIWTHNRWKI